MKKIALLMGGDSPEREVSLQSGAQVLAALNRLQKTVTVIDPKIDAINRLPPVDAVFNILHGGGGENGEMQGVLRSLGASFTGSGVLGSALAMDKHRAKMLWRGAGLSTADWCLAATAAEAAEVEDTLPLPLFVKPSCGGSSTNSGVAQTAEELPPLIAAAASEGAPAMIEKCIVGGEYTLSIVGDSPLPIIRISAARGFYDYHAKYVAADTRFLCPGGLSPAVEKTYTADCLRAFQLLGCRSWGRVDFMVDEDGEMVLLEVNTVPGMTSHSLVPMAAAAAGMDFDALVARILEGARCG